MATKKTTTTAAKTTTTKKATTTRATATKKTTAPTKTNTKVDFSDSINAIVDTAKTINTQVREVANEVVENIKENSEPLKEMTITPVVDAYNRTYNRVTETINMENINKAAKEMNDYTLKTAEGLVDGALENGEKWQGIATKAVKGGLKLAEKQQDMVFETLEAVKDQLTNNAGRLRKLFSKN